MLGKVLNRSIPNVTKLQLRKNLKVGNHFVKRQFSSEWKFPTNKLKIAAPLGILGSVGAYAYYKTKVTTDDKIDQRIETKPVPIDFNPELVSQRIELYRVPYSYSQEEIAEQKALTDSIEKISHKHYIGWGVGFHGTASEYEDSILSEIKMTQINNFSGESQLGEGFYVAVGEYEKKTALFFADMASFGKQDSSPVILRIHSKKFLEMKGIFIPRSQQWKALPWKGIPSHKRYVEDFDYIASYVSFGSDTDVKQWMQIKFNEKALSELIAEKVDL